jgi:hypothetical protein
MDKLQEGCACKLVNRLERVGYEDCGLLAAQGTVVMRCKGAHYTDTPTMMDEIDLQNAIAWTYSNPKRLRAVFNGNGISQKENPRRWGIGLFSQMVRREK